MAPHDNLVIALRALCEREGGYKAVAAAAKVSPDNLWQILTGRRYESGKLRSVGRELSAKLERAFPGWISIHPVAAGERPAPWSVAQSVSHLVDSDGLPFLPWENIMKASKLPEIFRSVLPDDALAPDLPRGTEIVWTTRRLRLPGRIVLARDRNGDTFARVCHQGRGPDHWRAVATNTAYLSLDSQVDGLVVLAVFKGRLEPDDA